MPRLGLALVGFTSLFLVASSASGASETPLVSAIEGGREVAIHRFPWTGKSVEAVFVSLPATVDVESILVVPCARGPVPKGMRLLGRGFASYGDGVDVFPIEANFEERPEGWRAILTSVSSFEVRAFDLVLPTAGDLCLNAIRAGSLKVTPLPRVTGTVRASRTVAPESANGPHALFDGTGATAWKAGAGKTPPLLEIRFADPQRVDEIAISGGNRASEARFWESARPRTIQARAAGGTGARTELADAFIAQGSAPLSFPAAVVETSLTLEFTSSYRGEKSQDLAVGEVVFRDGERWFSLDASDARAKNRQAIRKAFRDAGADEFLGRLLADKAKQWRVALFDDGSFVAFGRTAEIASAGSRRWKDFRAAGTFELGPVAKGKRELRLSGTLRSFDRSVREGDEVKRDAAGESSFQDTISVSAAGVEMRGKKPALGFSKLR